MGLDKKQLNLLICEAFRVGGDAYNICGQLRQEGYYYYISTPGSLLRVVDRHLNVQFETSGPEGPQKIYKYLSGLYNKVVVAPYVEALRKKEGNDIETS